MTGFNGLCITKLRLQAFIVTLASMNIARGLARFWANGIGIPLAYGKGEGMAPPAFEVLQMRLWGIVPVPAIIFIVLLIVFQIILSKTRFGRQVYAIGGSRNAAYLSGIKVDRIDQDLCIYDLRNAFICCCYDSRSSDQHKKI